jgi:hypothetical protein
LTKGGARRPCSSTAGTYLWELVKGHGRWQVTAMTFQLLETGDRRVAERAMAQTKFETA